VENKKTMVSYPNFKSFENIDMIIVNDRITPFNLHILSLLENRQKPWSIEK